jgi:hypothetical protein
MERTTSLVAIAVTALGLGLAARADEPSTLPGGDPPRWSVPAETPAQKYAVAMQEAGAALNEARKECRAVHAPGDDRKACENEAREQWKHEVREARRHLSNDNIVLR